MKFSKLTFALALWFSAWVNAAGPVYKLTLEAEGTVAYASAVHVGDGALVTVFHSFRPTESHPSIAPGDWKIDVDGLEGELVGQSPDNDLAFIQVEGLEGDALTMAPEGYEPDESITVTGFPGGGELQSYTGGIEGVWLEDGAERGIVLTCACHQGMSGGAVVDGNGVLIGVIHGVDDREHCWAISRVSFTRFCGHIQEVCPAWRPILHVWTSNRCGPCRQFWADFDTDADFRNTLLMHYRMPILPDGTVDKSRFNVDRHPALAAWWLGPNGGVPCFAISPDCRVFGYRGKEDLLIRLGIEEPVSQFPVIPSTPPTVPTVPSIPQAPEPSPPIVTTPPRPSEPSEPTLALRAILERLEGIEGRLSQIENRETHAGDIEAILIELESLRSHVEGIDALRIELAEMRNAQLLVRIRQSNGEIIEDTVEIFDPDDSLNLQLPAR